MRAAFVSTGLGTGGAEMALLRLLPALRAHGIDAIVVSVRSEGTIGPRLRAEGIPVAALDLPGIVAAASAWTRLLGCLRSFSPTLLHGWMYHGNLVALAAAGRLGLPVAWGIRQSLGLGTRDKWLTRRIIGAGARLSKRADLIVYNSAVSRTQHESRGYEAARAVVVPNGFDTEAWRPDETLRPQVRAELGIGQDAPLVAQVARYHPGKDYPTLLRAAAQVVSGHPAARFVLVGEGVDSDNEVLMPLVRELKLEEKVLMLGRRDDIGRLLAAADVAVLSSAGMEGFPNAIGEAMSCGVPCVGTRVGDLPHLIGETGELVPASDPQALAAALSRLLSMPPAGRRALGARARARIVDNFSIDEIAGRYANLLFEVAGKAH
jgi:glycosyltransferase involved in cell wall biosynthesis